MIFLALVTRLSKGYELGYILAPVGYVQILTVKTNQNPQKSLKSGLFREIVTFVWLN
jgi:hypothetical protein